MEIKKNPNVDLNKDRLVFRFLGYVFVFAVVIVLFSFTTFKKKEAKKKATFKGNATETVVNTVQQKTVAPPPPSATTVINLVENNSTEATDLSEVNFEDPIDIPTMNVDLGAGKQDDEIKDDVVFDPKDVEEQPMYGKTEEDLYTFLGENLVYPDAPRESGIEETIWVTFIIQKDGKVADVKTDGKGDPDLEAEAKRIIQLTSGNWTPAKYKKKPVRMVCKIPIEFSLE